MSSFTISFTLITLCKFTTVISSYYINKILKHLLVDGGLLLQPLANQAQSANARSKPDLVVKVAGMSGVDVIHIG